MDGSPIQRSPTDDRATNAFRQSILDFELLDVVVALYPIIVLWWPLTPLLSS